MGSLVLVPESVVPGQIAEYCLIDGQGQLTTLSLVLGALREAAAAAGLAELAREVALTTMENRFRKGTDPLLHQRLARPVRVDLCTSSARAGPGGVKPLEHGRLSRLCRDGTISD
jgi:hypothetical protein